VQGRKDQAGSVARVPAPEIERAVVEALKTLLGVDTTGKENGKHTPDRLLIDRHLGWVLVRPDMLDITARASEDGQSETLKIAWTAPPGRRKRDIIVPEGVDAAAHRPIHSDTRARLVEAIAKARHGQFHQFGTNLRRLSECRGAGTRHK
jgi:site-specific DNA recombinase